MITQAEQRDDIEAELIRQAKQGDRKAYAGLVLRHREGVVGVIYRMCGDIHLAEDAAQDAFLRAWQALPRYQPRSSFRSWLYRIAANRALDILRSERETLALEALPLPDGSRSLEAQAAEAERARLVQKAILALPPAARSVLVLREYEGMSYHEISETLEIPIGTVMSRLNYARNKLMEMLQDCLEAA